MMKFDPAYLITGPYQPRNINYPYKGPKNYRSSFQFSWFESHENWLNYILLYLYYNPALPSNYSYALHIMISVLQ